MEVLVENIEKKGVITPWNFTEEEFREEIRKAEKGPFYTIDEAESILEQWKNTRRKSMKNLPKGNCQFSHHHLSNC